MLVDNARALILGRDTETGVVHVHPAFSAFCADWGVAPRACRPYRARTKGKTESGVGYVKRNAIAGRSFDSFAALEAHLATWMIDADTRIHGTTHERPLDRFERDERQRCGRCPRGRCRFASGACRGASRPTRSSTSTRFATACRTASCAGPSRSCSATTRS